MLCKHGYRAALRVARGPSKHRTEAPAEYVPLLTSKAWRPKSERPRAQRSSPRALSVEQQEPAPLRSWHEPQSRGRAGRSGARAAPPWDTSSTASSSSSSSAFMALQGQSQVLGGVLKRTGRDSRLGVRQKPQLASGTTPADIGAMLNLLQQLGIPAG